MGKSFNLLKVTFLVSIALHALIFFTVFDSKKINEKNEQLLDLNYLALKLPPAEPQFKAEKTILEKIEDKTSVHKKVEKKIFKAHKKKEPDLLTKTVRTIRKINDSAVKKIELMEQNISKSEASKIEDPAKKKSYISYYKLINLQLQQAVIYPEVFSEGEVCLSFVLTRDGKLHDIDVVQETSLNNTALRETAMKIVENASPFPPFPENLQEQKLTFNVVFCFRETS